MIVVAIINLITLVFNRKDKILLLAYILALFSSSFYFLDFNYVSTIYILAALMIIIQVFRENMLYTNNTFYTVVVSIIIVAIGLCGINILTYKDKVKSIITEENKGYIQYEEDFFKNVSELGEDKDNALAHFEETLSHPVQIHYVGANKPWNRLFVDCQSTWLKHAWRAGLLTEFVIEFPIQFLRTCRRYSLKRFTHKLFHRFFR